MGRLARITIVVGLLGGVAASEPEGAAELPQINSCDCAGTDLWVDAHVYAYRYDPMYQYVDQADYKAWLPYPPESPGECQSYCTFAAEQRAGDLCTAQNLIGTGFVTIDSKYYFYNGATWTIARTHPYDQEIDCADVTGPTRIVPRD